MLHRIIINSFVHINNTLSCEEWRHCNDIFIYLFSEQALMNGWTTVWQVSLPYSLKLIRILRMLTHWGRVTHICVSKLTIIGSAPSHYLNHWRYIVNKTLRKNFGEISIKIHIFSPMKTHLKVSSAKHWPFCLGLNVLTKVSVQEVLGTFVIYNTWEVLYSGITHRETCLRASSVLHGWKWYWTNFHS